MSVTKNSNIQMMSDWDQIEIVIVDVTINRALFQKRRYLFKKFLFELVRRFDESMFFIQNNIQNKFQKSKHYFLKGI